MLQAIGLLSAGAPAVWLRPAVGIGAGVGVILFVIWLYWRQMRRFEALSRELGLRFREHGSRLPVPRGSFLGRTTLFSERGWSSFEMSGVRDDVQVSVFGYSRWSDRAHGKAVGCPFAVVALRPDPLALPEFLVRPEGWRQKLAQKFGGQDIDLPDQPRFSQLYRLSGPDETAIRGVFSDEVCRFFEDHPGVLAESVDGTLLYYRPLRILPLTLVSPSVFRTLLEDGLECLRVLHAQSSA